MTKHDRDDKAKVRFVYLEIEGGSAALQETVRSFAHTLARPPAQRGALLESANGAHVAPTKPPSKAPAEVVVTPPPQGSLFSTEENESAELDETMGPARPKAQRPVPRPQVVTLDLTTGPVNLESYCTEKKPASDLEKYLVVMAWLKQQRKIESVTMNEIFTCYRHLTWDVPPDPAQPLRDLKRRKNWVDKAEGKGAYAINHLGENVVGKMGATA